MSAMPDVPVVIFLVVLWEDEMHHIAPGNVWNVYCCKGCDMRVPRIWWNVDNCTTRVPTCLECIGSHEREP